MVRDPNYDRYKGISSIEDPASPGKRRAFMVDEDGNVHYQDRVGRAGNPRAEVVPGIQVSGDRLSRNGSGAPSKVARSRKTIGGIDYDVIEATTYDPALSNAVTALPNADVIEAMNLNRRHVAVTGKGPERGTRIVRLPFDFDAKTDAGPTSERVLPLTNPKSEVYLPFRISVRNPDRHRQQIHCVSGIWLEQWHLATAIPMATVTE